MAVLARGGRLRPGRPALSGDRGRRRGPGRRARPGRRRGDRGRGGQPHARAGRRGRGAGRPAGRGPGREDPAEAVARPTWWSTPRRSAWPGPRRGRAWLVAPAPAAPGQVVADLVYAPRPTPWLAAAAAAGATRSTGWGCWSTRRRPSWRCGPGGARSRPCGRRPRRPAGPADERGPAGQPAAGPRAVGGGGVGLGRPEPALASAASVASRRARVSGSRWDGTVSSMTRSVTGRVRRSAARPPSGARCSGRRTRGRWPPRAPPASITRARRPGRPRRRPGSVRSTTARAQPARGWPPGGCRRWG